MWVLWVSLGLITFFVCLWNGTRGCIFWVSDPIIVLRRIRELFLTFGTNLELSCALSCRWWLIHLSQFAPYLSRLMVKSEIVIRMFLFLCFSTYFLFSLLLSHIYIFMSLFYYFSFFFYFIFSFSTYSFSLS